jgi:hypothetical protein
MLFPRGDRAEAMDQLSNNHRTEEIPEEAGSPPGQGWLTHPFGIAGLGLGLMVLACMVMPLRLEDGQTPLRVPGQIAFLFGLLVTVGGMVQWYVHAHAERDNEREREHP